MVFLLVISAIIALYNNTKTQDAQDAQDAKAAQSKKARHIKKNSKAKFLNLKSSDTYEHKGLRYLKNFPKDWIYTPNYHNIECLNCLEICCYTEEGKLPLFLGYCSNCSADFRINDCDDVNCDGNCDVGDYEYYYRGNFCDKIIKCLNEYKYNPNDETLQRLQNLICLINDEYGNMDIYKDI
jgi:hypothetical protein